MLTCKSLFGLGYRGERLIEPLLTSDLVRKLPRWLRVLFSASHYKWQDRQIAGTCCQAAGRAVEGKLSRAPGLRAWGILIIQQIDTIRSQFLSAFEHMDAVHRLDVDRAKAFRYSRTPLESGCAEDCLSRQESCAGCLRTSEQFASSWFPPKFPPG